jgi:hypothetical protein
VNSRVLAIAAVAAVLVLGAGWYLIGRAPRPSTGGPVAAEPAPTTDAARERPEPVTPPAAENRRESSAPRASTEAPPVAPLPPAPDAGTLRVDSDVPGAEVFLDRQLVGRVPVTIPNVAPGPHRLNVSAEGFEGTAETIEVAPGPRDIMVRFREVRLEAALPVVHKHRVGSCKGQLSATPGGLRYETADSDDAFSAPLADVEVFEVDYLEKNLRVKLRRGKQFNFTDPDGNADRLFVFHRDVTKARERLAKGDVPASN